MKLNEAKEILKKNGFVLSEKKADPQYDHRGWARYGFNNPNKDRGYIKMLNFLYHAENGMTKKMIHNWMGLSTAPGNHSATWTEMSDAGLAKYDEHERVWKITAKGIKYLEDNDLIVPLEDLTDGAGQIDAYGDDKSAVYFRNKIIKLISDGSAMTWKEIADALDMSAEKAAPYIRSCLTKEYIHQSDSGDEFRITAKGRKYLEDNDLGVDMKELSNTDEESLKNKVVDIVNHFRRGCTREQIAMMLDVDVAELTGPIRACLDADEIVYNDDMGGFITPEYQAYLDGYDEPAKEETKFVDPDDDMYDDTPIVRQRDESFKAFAEKQGYSFVNEANVNTPRYVTLAISTKGLKYEHNKKIANMLYDLNVGEVIDDYEDGYVFGDIPMKGLKQVIARIKAEYPVYGKRLKVFTNGQLSKDITSRFV